MSSTEVTIGSIENSTFAIGDGATVAGGGPVQDVPEGISYTDKNGK